jgi:hypothetical protein
MPPLDELAPAERDVWNPTVGEVLGDLLLRDAELGGNLVDGEEVEFHGVLKFAISAAVVCGSDEKPPAPHFPCGRLAKPDGAGKVRG